MDLQKLKEPFKQDEIEWRLSQSGESNGKIWAHCLAYISARAIMDRLDQVCGPENWQVTYVFIEKAGVICNLSIQCGSQWITKQDGAEMTDIEAFKGGISSALKRAGSAWGVGRYLYGLETGFAAVVEKGTKGALYGKTKNGTPFYWVPPQLPVWALPATVAEVHAKGVSIPKVLTPKVNEIVPTPKPEEDPEPEFSRVIQNDRAHSLLVGDILILKDQRNISLQEIISYCKTKFGREDSNFLTVEELKEVIEWIRATFAE